MTCKSVNSKDCNVVMLNYILLHDDCYGKTVESLYQYVRDKTKDNAANLTSTKFQGKLTGSTLAANDLSEVLIDIPLKVYFFLGLNV